MAFKKMFKKAIIAAVKQGVVKPVTPMSKPITSNIIKKNNKTIKYASVRKNQSGIVTSGGLLSNNLKISKKKLLGS